VKAISFAQTGNSLKAVLDAVAFDSQNATLITDTDGQDTVLMTLECYNGLMETLHLLRSPANLAHLEKSIGQYRAGKTTQRELLDE